MRNKVHNNVCSGLVEASLFTPSSPPLCVWTKGGAGLSCCGCIGDCMKQQGHFTSLQLKSMNQWTKQYVQTSALHNSSRGWHSIFKQIGHCNCSMIAGLFMFKSVW
eukprot:Em0021g713a